MIAREPEDLTLTIGNRFVRCRVEVATAVRRRIY